MVALTWNADTVEALAKRWGVSESTVLNYSAETNRFLQLADEFAVNKAALNQRVSRGINACEEQGDMKNYFAGIKLLMQANGHMAPSKTEISGPDGGPVQMAGVVVLPALEPEGNESE